MKPIIRVKKTFLGNTLQFNNLNKPFLKQDVDLAPAFFGEPLNFYISLPKDEVKGHVFNSNFILNQSKLIVSEIYKANLLLVREKKPLSAYFYLFTEIEGVHFLLTIRFVAEIIIESRNKWSNSVNLSQYNCCFRNYCHDFNLTFDFKNLDSNEIIADSSVLNKHCYYKRKHVEIKPAIWTYVVNDVPFDKIKSLRVNFSFQPFSILGGILILPFFNYGSVFKSELEQVKDEDTPFDTGPFVINCKDFYSNLHNKENFSRFVLDCLRNLSFYVSFFRDDKHPNNELVFQFIGCSFVFHN